MINENMMNFQKKIDEMQRKLNVINDDIDQISNNTKILYKKRKLTNNININHPTKGKIKINKPIETKNNIVNSSNNNQKNSPPLQKINNDKKDNNINDQNKEKEKELGINNQLKKQRKLEEITCEHIITPYIQNDELNEINKRLKANGGRPIESQLESIIKYGNSDNPVETLRQINEDAAKENSMRSTAFAMQEQE